MHPKIEELHREAMGIVSYLRWISDDPKHEDVVHVLDSVRELKRNLKSASVWTFPDRGPEYVKRKEHLKSDFIYWPCREKHTHAILATGMTEDEIVEYMIPRWKDGMPMDTAFNSLVKERLVIAKEPLLLRDRPTMVLIDDDDLTQP